MQNIYYVYALLDSRKQGYFVFDDLTFKYEPFYIGKGHSRRAFIHLKYTEDNLPKSNKINKILRSGKVPLVVLIATDLTESEAYRREREIIKLIGLDKLTNILEGGLGRTSNSMRGSKNPMFGKKRPKALIAKMQVARNLQINEGKTLEEIVGKDKAKQMRSNYSLKRKGRSWEEYFGKETAKRCKEELRNRLIGGHHSVETREKIRIGNLNRDNSGRSQQMLDRFKPQRDEAFEKESLILELLSHNLKYAEIQRQTQTSVYFIKAIMRKNGVQGQ